MTKYKNKYHVESHRLYGWDYGQDAIYFITICTRDRYHYFGKIIDGKMILSDIGKLAEKYWLEIPKHFPFVILHNHIIMPNHVHGLIEIAKNDDNVDAQNIASPQNIESPENTTQTQNIASLPAAQNEKSYKNRFGPQSQNLASIIRGFKIGVTKNARQINANFGWQRNYHDHIVRNKKSYRNIYRYITNNPKNWANDKFAQ